MRVLIVRHGVAEEQPAGGGDDAARRLTKVGRRKMHKAAAGLAGAAAGELDLLACSPLVRAAQTAEILAEAFDGMKPVIVDSLKPGKPVKAVLQWLQGQPADSTVALVGHEPQLGMLVSLLLSGESRSFVRVKKGSGFLLEFGGKIKAGGATLLWAMTPNQLRKLRA